MSNVRVNKRRVSKIEFDSHYFRIHDDAIFLISIDFGANDKLKKILRTYIDSMAKKIYADMLDIGKNIKIANSIYPVNKREYEERRVHQDKAIGLCYDLICKYQLIMKTLGIRDDKYVIEVSNIAKEIDHLKKWRLSDSKRFKKLG